MISNWARHLIWHPLEAPMRRRPPIALNAERKEVAPGVVCLKVYNRITNAIASIGGFEYSVVYIIGRQALIDTGFPWARNALRETLDDFGMTRSSLLVMNTHYHEDHVGNNDLLLSLGGEVYAPERALPKIRFPEGLPWYRDFFFGPQNGTEAKCFRGAIASGSYEWEPIPLPGHSPDHTGIFEKNRRWLFGGDLYMAPDLDSQLSEVRVLDWIQSLDAAVALRPTALFDGHGTILLEENGVREALTRKRDFLIGIRDRVHIASRNATSIADITHRVFSDVTLVNALSFHNGWHALLTSGDFSRSNLIKSILYAAPVAS